MPGFIGMPELILLGLVALIVFGPKRLPEMGRGLGKGMREFKESVTGEDKRDETDAAGRPALTQAQADVAAPPQAAETAPPQRG